LRFDFRKRLISALFANLIFLMAFGIMVACALSGIAFWIWSFPVLAAAVFGLLFVIRHGDRIAVAQPGANSR